MSKQPLRLQPDYPGDEGGAAVPRASARRVASRHLERASGAKGTRVAMSGGSNPMDGMPKKAGIPFAITRSEYEYDGSVSNAPVRKVWSFEIDFRNDRGQQDTLYGRIVAAGAGPVHEPLESYDVTAYAN